MSTLSRAKPPDGTRRACIFSVKTAGSRDEAPYTALVDLSTNRRTDGARWQAARSCIVPMTLSSFIGPRPPAPEGMELMFMCTTVSTDAFAMTLPISGLRMSARTNSVRPSRRSISADGGTVSTPMPRPMDGSEASSAAKAPPSHRLTPVTRTTEGGTSLSSLLVASLDAGLLEQLAVLLLRHPLAPLLDDRTHVLCSRRHSPLGAPDRSADRPRRAPCEVISSCATTPIRGRVVAGRPSLPGRPTAMLPRANRTTTGGAATRGSGVAAVVLGNSGDTHGLTPHPWRDSARRSAPRSFLAAMLPALSSRDDPRRDSARRSAPRSFLAAMLPALSSRDVGVGVAQVVLDGPLGHAE